MESLVLKNSRVKCNAYRDEAGVPHVQTETWLESLYALGYLHAIDRPTQIHFARTVASGRAAELIADRHELREMDHFLRRSGIQRQLSVEVGMLAPEILEQIQWYCRGVNDGLETVGRTLPMWAVGFKPTPWEPESVLLIGNLLSFAGLAVGEQEAERVMLELIQLGIEPERLRELFRPYLDGVDFDALQDIRVAKQMSDDALELLSDLPRLAGSNAWAVAPARSETGGALLASDPHLEVNRLPAIWYEAVLRWGDGPIGDGKEDSSNKQADQSSEHKNARQKNVEQDSSGAHPAGEYAMGATLPGCPLMAVGRTSKLSWGVTYMHANTSDYFVEDLRRKPTSEGDEQVNQSEASQSETNEVEGPATENLEAEKPATEDTETQASETQPIWQYRRDQEWLDYQPRTELIARKGGKPIKEVVYENEVGTLTLAPDAPGKYLSVSWVGSRPRAGRSIGVWLDVISSQTTANAMKSVKSSPHPSLVWIFADSEGHIGKQACGWLPMRKKASGLVPVPAWDESNHWLGVVPADNLPSEYDPARGFVASANEEMFMADGSPLHSHGLHDYRRRRVDERLTELPHANVVDMQRLQYDVLSIHARELLPVLTKHLDDCELKQKLEAWDFRFNPESYEASLFMAFYRSVLLEIFGHEQGIGWRRMVYLATRIGYSAMVMTALDRVLPKTTSSWWRTRDKTELIRRAAERAMAVEPEAWSDRNAFHFVNRFFGGMKTGKLLGFNSSKTAMPGCHATPFQGHLKATSRRESTFAPSYHFVADMSTNLAWTNLPGGPSENRFSKWYRNDIPLWCEGKYKSLFGYQ